MGTFLTETVIPRESESSQDLPFCQIRWPASSVYGHGVQRPTLVFFSIALHLIFWDRVFHQTEASVLGRLDGQEDQRLYLSPPPPCTGVTGTLPNFLNSTWVLVTRFRSLSLCANTLPTEPPPHPNLSLLSCSYSFWGKLISHFSFDLCFSDNNRLFFIYLTDICISC